MRYRLGIGVMVFAVAAFVAPGLAFGHAYLVKTVPTPNAHLSASPPDVQLTFDEAVEPRFAIISVSSAEGDQLTTAPVSRSPSNPDTLVVPLKPHLPSGWYLIYWRAISVDGHPVQGAYTFSVGANPGAPPQFVIPNIAETATSTNELVARWAMFLSAMLAIGLFAFRIAIARPVVRHVEGASLRPVSIACLIATAVAVIAAPVYVDISTAIDSLRSPFDIANLIPLFRVTAFGRAYVDFAICMVAFLVCEAIALWVDRPERPQRTLAELLSLAGTTLVAASALLIPGLAGHAAQTAPRALTLTLDWLHLVSGSIWVGGLAGLLVVWVTLPAERRSAGLSVCVPRFSNVALVSVLVLLASGTAATIIHIPVVSALWQTSYGIAILVKIGLLSAAMLLGAVNLFRVRPRLIQDGGQTPAGRSAVRWLRRTVSGELLLAVCAVFAAAVLSSLPPPAAAFAEYGHALADVGPGHVAASVSQDGYRLDVLVSPNKVAQQNEFTLRVTKNGEPVTGADVTLGFDMLDMEMGNQEYQMTEKSPGIYVHAAPALVMSGHWGLTFTVTPKTGEPFTAIIVDHALG